MSSTFYRWFPCDYKGWIHPCDSSLSHPLLLLSFGGSCPFDVIVVWCPVLSCVVDTLGPDTCPGVLVWHMYWCPCVAIVTAAQRGGGGGGGRRGFGGGRNAVDAILFYSGSLRHILWHNMTKEGAEAVRSLVLGNCGLFIYLFTDTYKAHSP